MSGGFMSGGAGYVISRKALHVFAKIAHEEKKCDFTKSGLEDVEMSTCFDKIGKTIILLIAYLCLQGL